MKIKLQQIFSAITLLSIEMSAYAANVFDTSWGKVLKTSPQGKLFFALMQVLGIWVCMQSLFWIASYAQGHQHAKHGYGRCSAVFLCGCLMYFMPETLNVLYNTLF